MCQLVNKLIDTFIFYNFNSPKTLSPETYPLTPET